MGFSVMFYLREKKQDPETLYKGCLKNELGHRLTFLADFRESSIYTWSAPNLIILTYRIIKEYSGEKNPVKGKIAWI